MCKPIFIIIVPIYLTHKEIAELRMKLYKHELSDDYHTIVINGEKEQFDFKVFYEKDFSEIKYEELKLFIIENNKI